ncbi:MAG: hypothetical protein KKF41_15920 [Actinobacteria bacterium]|nr:hypothetical protein [Actinomycetota bacterium]MBU2689066.1 hypothetical protein [Actinomycetota bacterium]
MSACTMFVSIAAAGSSWPWSFLALGAGALSLAGLFLSAARLGLLDPVGRETVSDKEGRRLKRAA